MAKATDKEPSKGQKDSQKDSKTAAKDSKKDSSKESKKKDSKKKGEEEASNPKEIVQFVKDSWGEFRKIQWPTPRQAANESVVVLLTVIFMIALVNLYDFISNFLLGFILQK